MVKSLGSCTEHRAPLSYCHTAPLRLRYGTSLYYSFAMRTNSVNQCMCSTLYVYDTVSQSDGPKCMLLLLVTHSYTRIELHIGTSVFILFSSCLIYAYHVLGVQVLHIIVIRRVHMHMHNASHAAGADLRHNFFFDDQMESKLHSTVRFLQRRRS